PWSSATAGACSPTVTAPPRGATDTMSGTGPKVVRPTCRTWPCSAAAITRRYITPAGTSKWPQTADLNYDHHRGSMWIADPDATPTGRPRPNSTCGEPAVSPADLLATGVVCGLDLQRRVIE